MPANNSNVAIQPIILMEQKTESGLALLFTAPIATISLIIATAFGGIIGSAVWMLGKVWQIGFPGFWRIKVEKKEISKSPCPEGGIKEGIILGIAMSVVMFIAWILAQDSLDNSEIRGYVEPFGLLNPWLYFAAFVYWFTFNSLLEEYLFRWFIFEKFETFVSGKWAVVLASLAFTSHHVFGSAAMFPWWAITLASIGVFTGGVMWSWLYLRHRSIWPSYVSHVIVDITMFGIGAYILFA